MLKFFARYKTFAIVFTILSAIIVFFIYKLKVPDERLPVYQPDMVSKELVDSTVQYVRKYHKIADFKLVNQNGDTITQDTYKGKIYVADFFFFTTCLTICPIMTDHMVKIQEKNPGRPHGPTPVSYGLPGDRQCTGSEKYALEKGVVDSKWNLVTGDKKQIYELARKSYLATKTKGDGGKYDMIHTENFVLVDPDKRIRGFYDGTDPEAIDKLLHDIEVLEKEYRS